MRSIKGLGAYLAVTVALALSLTCLFASSTRIDALQAVIEAVQTTTPLPADQLPRVANFYSAQRGAAYPPLPCNSLNLPCWVIDDWHFVMDDRDVDYAAIHAEAEAEALLSAGLNLPMSTMASSLLNTAAAYGNPAYLTNMAASFSGSTVTSSLSVAGGTNNVPYDILMSTNVADPVLQWTWLGIGYTSNSYSFANQPLDQAFYILARPEKTMVVGFGNDVVGQCDVPAGITNALMVAGGGGQSLALLTDGTVAAWGQDADGQGSAPTNLAGVTMISAGWYHDVALLTNGTVVAWGLNAHGLYNLTEVPSDLTNATVISAQALHTLALTSNGTVVAWGYGPDGEASAPSGLSNVVAIAAGFQFNLAARADGTVTAWGNNAYGQTNVPAGLSNVVDVAAGPYHCLALLKNGTVVAWGDGSCGETNVPAGLTNVVAIAASGDPTLNDISYSLALKNDGSVVAWGAGEPVAPVAGMSNVIAIAAGGDHALAVRTGPRTPVITLEPTNQCQIAGGNVTFIARGAGLYGVSYQWQTNGMDLPGATNASLALTNVQDSDEMDYRIVATDLGGNGSIASSNASFTLVRPPLIISQSQPTNIVCGYGKHVSLSVVASAAGTTSGFPLTYHWELNGTNIAGPAGSGYAFFADDTSAGVYIVTVSNVVGTATARWQVTLTDDVNVTNDLLLIYNTNSADSTFVKDYYLANRPNVTGANVLGVGWPGLFVTNGSGAGALCYDVTNTTVYESITGADYTNRVQDPVLSWLSQNPDKKPQYVILFLDVPSRLDASANSPTNYPFITGLPEPSVSYLLRTVLPDWRPYITHINMNGTNDCVAYINKLASLGVPISSNSPILSASTGGYSNTNYMLDGARHGSGYTDNYSGFYNIVSNATTGLALADVPAASIHFNDGLDTIDTNTVPPTYFNYPKITRGTNLAGYMCWGVHSDLGPDYAINDRVKWDGDSGWWIIETVESGNGQRFSYVFGTFAKWFSRAAFGGADYSNTPIGAVSHTDEPGLGRVNKSDMYFGAWAAGKTFGFVAWYSSPFQRTPLQVIGDPLIRE